MNRQATKAAVPIFLTGLLSGLSGRWATILDNAHPCCLRAFAYQPERASLKEKLGRPFLEAKQGKDAPARLLTYLWGGRPATDDWFENPYTGKAGYMKILSRPDEPEGVWLSHKVNVAADFEARFSYPPPRLLYIAVSADTDDTKSSLTAHLRALRFSAE